MLRLLLYLVLMVTTACDGPPPVYTNMIRRGEPGTGQVEFDRDWYECRLENKSLSYVRAGRFSDGGTVVDEKGTALCMRARGWKRTS